jgi:hypothetical protein
MPPSMEGSRRLRLPLFCGVVTCLEEGAYLAGRTCICQISLRRVLCGGVSSSKLQAAKEQDFSEIEQQGRRAHHAWAHLPYGTCIAT